MVRLACFAVVIAFWHVRGSVNHLTRNLNEFLTVLQVVIFPPPQRKGRPTYPGSLQRPCQGRSKIGLCRLYSVRLTPAFFDDDFVAFDHV